MDREKGKMCWKVAICSPYEEKGETGGWLWSGEARAEHSFLNGVQSLDLIPEASVGKVIVSAVASSGMGSKEMYLLSPTFARVKKGASCSGGKGDDSRSSWGLGGGRTKG